MLITLPRPYNSFFSYPRTTPLYLDHGNRVMRSMHLFNCLSFAIWYQRRFITCRQSVGVKCERCWIDRLSQCCCKMRYANPPSRSQPTTLAPTPTPFDSIRLTSNLWWQDMEGQIQPQVKIVPCMMRLSGSRCPSGLFAALSWPNLQPADQMTSGTEIIMRC